MTDTSNTATNRTQTVLFSSVRGFTRAKGLFSALVIALLVMSCKSALYRESASIRLADPQATASTSYTQMRIKEIASKGYAFGHQDATAYGMGWKNDGSLRKSDVAEVSGDFPGVFGFEIGHIELGHVQNLDSVNFGLMTQLIREAHESGGIVTISWHPDNPTTGKSAWDPSPAVNDILEGGTKNATYRQWVERVAVFLHGLKTRSGKPIPIVFRPFHEMNGTWFWWGAESCSPEEFKDLWRETFNLLTQTYQVHNLLFCYSTDAVGSREEYLRFYPGDAYVDILGMDLYHKETTEKYMALLENNLSLLSQIGKQKNKPYAMTEGGLNMVPLENWWTDVLDQSIADKGIAWALVWRNAWPNHYYGPFNGQASSENFKLFKALNHVLFLSDVKKIR